MGQDYERLHRCVSISLLDFSLLAGDRYHSVYRLRETDGTELTDLLEIHIVEMSKALQGTEGLEDWIRLFNAKSEEDLEMIKAKNIGIREAIGAIREMSLRKNLRYLYEEHIKSIRDRRAEDAFIRDEARAEGKFEGRTEGRIEGRSEGRIEGRAESILQILGELENVPEDLSRRIMAEKDIDTLNMWLKAAAKAKDIKQFREECEI